MTSTRAPLAGVTVAADACAPALSAALAALARTAARLLSTRTAVLALDGPDGERLHAWTDGEPADLGAWAPAVAALCGRVRAVGAPLAASDLRDDLALRRDGVALPGEASFAGAPLPGGVLAVLEPRPRAWAPAELAALAELAVAAVADLERQHAETELEELVAVLSQSEGRYRRLLATCPCGIYAVDASGRLTEVNAAITRILGRSAEEVVGVRFDRFLPPEDRERSLAAFRSALRAGDAPAETELRILRPSGEQRTLQVIRSPIEEDGRVVGSQGVVRDVTEERAKERQLRRAERMASVAPLLSGVCHELNNPLTSIQSFTELMLLDERPEEDREALEIVCREAHRAAKIVADLRVVARQSQESGSSRGTVALHELVEQVLRQRRERLERAGISVLVDVPDDLPCVCGVRSQLEQVLLHLVSNAEHALLDHPGPRQIAVRGFPGDLGVALLVDDTGGGIPEGEIDRIFDPFWTTREPGQGTGLGLSVAQSIVSDHGGRISVESRPDHGARFLVELPVTSAPPLDLGDRDDGAAGRGLRVLVVDDEAPIRFSLARYLERRGHRVIEAAEGVAALRLVEESTNGDDIDIILADLRMPGLDGGEFLARLRLRGDGLEHRLVFMTGDADSPDADRVLRDAGVPVVWKPFELAEVAQIVEAQAGLLA